MKVQVRKIKKIPAPVATEQVLRFMGDKEIDYYCKQYELMKFPIYMLKDCVNENIHIDKNGEKFALVPPLWVYNYLTPCPSKVANWL